MFQVCWDVYWKEIHSFIYFYKAYSSKGLSFSLQSIALTLSRKYHSILNISLWDKGKFSDNFLLQNILIQRNSTGWKYKGFSMTRWYNLQSTYVSSVHRYLYDIHYFNTIRLTYSKESYFLFPNLFPLCILQW